MSSLKSGFVFLLLSGVVACSAAGTDPNLASDAGAGKDAPYDAYFASILDANKSDSPATNPQEAGPNEPVDAYVAPSGDDSSTGDDTEDAGMIDAYVAPFDAALAPEGSTCTTDGATESETCGVCGTSTRLCGHDADGGLVWLAWGACTNELAGGCTPGTSMTIACGLCGTLTETCANDCSYAVTACTGQVAGGCIPGDVQYTTASCVTAGTEQSRTCSNACAWGDYSGTCSAAPNYITVSGTTSTVHTITATLASSLQLLKAETTCPTTLTTGASNITPYSYVEVRNTLSFAAVVSVWGSQVGGGSDLSTVTAAYTGATAPSGTAAREACLGNVTDYCYDLENDPTACLDNWSGLMYDSDPNYDQSITIPANSSVLIYTAGQTTSDTGAYQLNVRTEQLN